MQIVIDIPEEEYNTARFMGFIHKDIIFEAIKNSTPLPKGHGRLIDADKVKENHERWIGYLDEDMITRLNIAVDKHIPTVIEADKDGE